MLFINMRVYRSVSFVFSIWFIVVRVTVVQVTSFFIVWENRSK